MVASVEAIFLSAFILITQNRMMSESDKCADLNLQISLLSEHEITRLLRLVRAIADRMDIEDAGHTDLDELEKNVRPEAVLETMEHHEKRSARV